MTTDKEHIFAPPRLCALCTQATARERDIGSETTKDVCRPLIR